MEAITDELIRNTPYNKAAAEKQFRTVNYRQRAVIRRKRRARKTAGKRASANRKGLNG